jgi:hypothetical protein
MFGPLQVELNGQPLPRLRSRKGHWLLALLVLRHGREVERAWLAGMLWPDSPVRFHGLLLAPSRILLANSEPAPRVRTPLP